MARTASEKTAAQKNAEAARLAHTKAKEALDKKPDDAKLIQGVKDARAKMEAAEQAESRERFVKYAGGRTSQALTAIENIGATFKPGPYHFEQKDADQIVSALRDAITALETKMKAGLNAPKAGSKKRAKETKFAFA